MPNSAYKDYSNCNFFINRLSLNSKINVMCKIDNYNFEGKKAIIRVDLNVLLDKKFLVCLRHQHQRCFKKY